MSATNNEIKAIWLDETHLSAITEFRDACGEDWDDHLNFDLDDVETLRNTS